ncbi:tRNA lysidine(34) synthetase TilS [Limimaricola hongkongensis]|uniref:tRNA(Ile)-lysidine synthase n=1 Tax=Limimaricola hongkongensis DSM 17492 TaxID=1122180 RepID=A0A017H9G8_9RHOB|nr:tRNA lysidine(34) synthetase TilS [Limimaricola hongkongensis]EYD71127.1 tRNA(Ile)-lysidine synthetase [Limimaricola hongkongensis DSM 17492]
MTPPDALLWVATRCFETGPRKGLGLAVSGGGDSMALLHMLGPEARARGLRCRVATVDHGLRPEARAEAARVAAACARLGLSHEILDWRGWDGQGNLQDAARRARMTLLAGWAERHDLDAVALGHTRDDQAETVLMRLGRGSGVDGLSGMAKARGAGGLTWLRPLLELRRDDLRRWLEERGLGWDDDPSNTDPRFLRVRARAALKAIEPVGVTPDGLVATAERMALAREALEHLADDLSSRATRLACGAVAIKAEALARAPAETRLRLVSAALRWIGGSVYRPRLGALRAALDGAATARRTLGGVVLEPWRGALWLSREIAATGPAAEIGAPWDGRWIVTGPVLPGARIAALGPAGLPQCPGWRELGVARAALLASPAVWQGETLIAAPCAGRGGAWSARIVAGFPYRVLPH